MIRFDTIFEEAYSLKVTSLRAAKKLLEKYNFRGEVLRVIEELKNRTIKPIAKPQYIEDGWHHLPRGFK